jgi:hypothetical protein
MVRVGTILKWYATTESRDGINIGVNAAGAMHNLEARISGEYGAPR